MLRIPFLLLKLLIPLLLVVFPLMIGGRAGVPSLPPGPKTPTNLVVQVNALEIGTNPIVPAFNIFDVPKRIDVITANGVPDLDEFGGGFFRKDGYRVINIHMEGTGQFRGFDPCTGEELPDETDIFFPDGIPNPDEPDNTLIIKYNAPIPGTDLLPGAILISRFTIRDQPTEIRLVFFATNSVICASSDPPVRYVQDQAANLKDPRGIALDLLRDRYIIANDAVHEIHFYRLGDDSGADPLNPVTPFYRIRGSNTHLDRPGGVHLNPWHWVDPVYNEFGVVNSGSKTSVVFFQNDMVLDAQNNPIENRLPKREISGINTELDEPSALFIEPINNEIMVANIGSNSLTFYNGGDVGNAVPKRSLEGFNTGISEPSGLVYHPGWDLIFVSNTAVNSVGMFDYSALLPQTGPVDASPVVLLKGSSTRLDGPTGIFYEDSLHFNGFAAGGTSGSLDAPGFLFEPDEFFYNRIIITGGTGAGQTRTIIGNSEDQIFVSPPWGVIPDATSEYSVIGDNLFVSNSGDDRVLIFSIYDILSNVDPFGVSDVAPLFTLRGKDTKIRIPQGVAADPLTGEVYVVNNDAILDEINLDSVVVLNKNKNRTIQMERLPRIVNDATQQAFYPRYFFTGFLDEFGNIKPEYFDGFGKLIPDKIFLEGKEGYDMVWRIKDDRLKQDKDVSEAVLLPPFLSVFQLADGTFSGNLELGCNQFNLNTFIIHLFTSCETVPFAVEPFPLATAEYSIPAVVLGDAIFNKIDFVTTPRKVRQFPVPLPTVNVDGSNFIRGLNWIYAGEENPLSPPFPPLMIFRQDVRIFLKGKTGDLNPCFKPKGGAENLVLNVPALDPLTRTLPEVTENGCEIDYTEVSEIQFEVWDAMENRFIYNWVPRLPIGP